MARVVELIKQDTETRLAHPVVGEVNWAKIGVHGWGLFFAKGPEQGELLAADYSVLIDGELPLP